MFGELVGFSLGHFWSFFGGVEGNGGAGCCRMWDEDGRNVDVVSGGLDGA